MATAKQLGRALDKFDRSRTFFIHTGAGNEMTFLERILNEVQRATVKFPTWPTDPLHALAVLGEEFGELNKAMLQLTYEPHKSSQAAVREEAIQTAAMALRLAMSLDRYEYRRSEQHEQAAARRDSAFDPETDHY